MRTPKPDVRRKYGLTATLACDQRFRSRSGEDNEENLIIRLGTRDYEELRPRVLQRDGWRCQFCGSRENLQLHRQQFRSHSGQDYEDNLITLCIDCHSAAHNAKPVETY